MDHSGQSGHRQRPTGDDAAEWRAYWSSFGNRYRINDELWRTAPEISADRQRFLAGRRELPVHIGEAAFPFKDIKLTRADVEWLLATHASANGRDEIFTGPIDWQDPQQWDRPGLDLRGADLSGADLGHLPLSRMIGGLTLAGWRSASEDQRDAAAVNLTRAVLHETKLEGAELWGASLDGARLERARLDGASLGEASLEGADLRSAHLEGATLRWAHLERADLREAHLEHADLRAAHVVHAQLDYAFLQGADLRQALLEGTNLTRVHFEGKLVAADTLERIRRWQADFPAELLPADLRQAVFSSTSKLDFATLGDAKGAVSLADVHWGGVDLALVDWEGVTELGDERRAKERYDGRETRVPGASLRQSLEWRKPRGVRLEAYQAAVRAYRQLATTLREQGLNEEAANYAFHAQRMQRVVYRRQITLRRVGHRKRGPRQRFNSLLAYLFAVFIGVVAGYGYRPSRTVLWYLAVILSFTGGYLVVTHAGLSSASPLQWYEALVLSVSAFHGRGFFQKVSEGDPVAILAAGEAVIGLIIEISFIASVTLRFFGKGIGN